MGASTAAKGGHENQKLDRSKSTVLFLGGVEARDLSANWRTELERMEPTVAGTETRMVGVPTGTDERTKYSDWFLHTSLAPEIRHTERGTVIDRALIWIQTLRKTLTDTESDAIHHGGDEE